MSVATIPSPSKNFHSLVPLGSLDAYINWAHGIPILSAEKENALTERIQKHGDIDAVKELILSHLRFVVYVSKSYQGYGLPQADIIQEGNIGLMKAIRRFDPGVGVRFVSFAVYWIKSEIQEYILKNWRIVKVATTKAQRSLFFKLRKYMKKFCALSTDEIHYIADTLNVKPDDVKTMEQRLSGHDASFEPSQGDDETDFSFSPSAFLTSDQGESPEQNLISTDEDQRNLQNLRAAFSQMNERHQDIIQKRWLCPPEQKATLHELAAYYNISAERVRQLEKSALQQLKKHMPVDTYVASES
mgnify:CR=1 FL=1